jgi:hypothetical protein
MARRLRSHCRPRDTFRLSLCPAHHPGRQQAPPSCSWRGALSGSSGDALSGTLPPRARGSPAHTCHYSCHAPASQHIGAASSQLVTHTQQTVQERAGLGCVLPSSVLGSGSGRWWTRAPPGPQLLMPHVRHRAWSPPSTATCTWPHALVTPQGTRLAHMRRRPVCRGRSQGGHRPVLS